MNPRPLADPIKYDRIIRVQGGHSTAELPAHPQFYPSTIMI
ncbi:protein of unknown function [Candidatus Nitrosocaldus cavascurensis]|uniref:Uncharacterized protein n=1 Tax=Candidatus Nitrosocaldus cavascurensis TaxID=2058097 RepID=A0A2K5ASU0_9ARCH|nr:protein of unknown function [Candidatus Nitrosocaldus cavascurensis]